VRTVTVTIANPVKNTVSGRQQEGRPARWGRWAFAWLFVLGSVSHIVIALGFRETYRDFAEWSPFAWVQDAWESVFMPNAMILGVLLGCFEVFTGTLILKGGKTMQLGLLAAIAFHVGLIFFGMWAVERCDDRPP
jgi:hypothetical protein